MGGYGYIYRNFSTYNTVKEESRSPAVKPFVPFVPNTNSNSDGHVTKKTIVPVASRPYSDEYPARGDDYGSPHKVDEFLTKVQNEASRPPRFTPVSSTDWRQPPQPTTYNNSANGYGDYGSNKEGGRKPVGGTIRNDNYDGYSSPNGYGDYGNKEGRKPIGSTIRNHNYDGPNGYGDYGNYDNKEGRKPIGGTIRNDSYDGYKSPNGYGDYGNKEGYKSDGSPIRNDHYDGYNGANNGYGNKDGYHGGNGYGDYGNYSNKEGYKPSGSSVLSDNYDRHRPAENYSATEPKNIIPGGWNKPKISTAWTASPRKGTQLSKPTNDIDKAVELLKVAAKLNDHSNKEGHKPGGTAYGDYQRRHDEPTSKFSKGVELAKEAERLKNILTGTPQSRSSVPIEPSNKDFGDATRRYVSRPSTPQTHVTFVDGREADYRDNIDGRDDTRRYGDTPIIDSWKAEKKYKGARV